MRLTGLRAARRAAGLHVVTFNVWVGQPVDRLKKNLLQLVKAYNKPHIIILQEAHRWRAGSIRGYQAVRCSQNQFDEDNNNIILVRNDGVIKYRQSRRVPDASWTWNGNFKPARVFNRVVVHFKELGPTWWDIIGGHRVPMGPSPRIDKNQEAWNKEHKFLLDWVQRINKRRPRRVIIIGADWNTRITTEPRHPASLDNFMNSLPKPNDLAMKGIDGFAGVNVTFTNVQESDQKFGSDAHQPVSARCRPNLKEAA